MWRRAGIGLAVLAFHAVLFIGLLVMRIVDVRAPATRAEPAMTYITLPPLLPPRPSRTKNSGAKGTGGAPPVYFNPSTYGRPGANAITLPPIAPYVAESRKHCPSPIRPGSPEWERQCAPPPKTAKDADGTEDFSLVPKDSPAFKMWEREQKKRNAPVELPCTYVRTDPATGTKSNMTDVGCSMRKMFGR